VDPQKEAKATYLIGVVNDIGSRDSKQLQVARVAIRLSGMDPLALMPVNVAFEMSSIRIQFCALGIWKEYKGLWESATLNAAAMYYRAP
jgi:hypothetical protein